MTTRSVFLVILIGSALAAGSAFAQAPLEVDARSCSNCPPGMGARAANPMLMLDTLRVTEDTTMSCMGRDAGHHYCDRDSLRSAIRHLPRNVSCATRAQAVAARISPWRGLTSLRARMDAFTQMARGPVGAITSGLRDPDGAARTMMGNMLCISAHETKYLEPTIMNYNNCDGNRPGSLATGLGQFTKDTVIGVASDGAANGIQLSRAEDCEALRAQNFPVRCGGAVAYFESRLSGFRGITDGSILHALMPGNPRLQLEFFAFLLWAKAKQGGGLRGGGIDYATVLRSYGDGTPGYGPLIGSCVRCLTPFLSASGGLVESAGRSPESCLNLAAREQLTNSFSQYLTTAIPEAQVDAAIQAGADRPAQAPGAREHSAPRRRRSRR